MLRNNLDYIKEQLVKEEKFVRKEIEQIKLEQQNLKETLEIIFIIFVGILVVEYFILSFIQFSTYLIYLFIMLYILYVCTFA